MKKILALVMALTLICGMLTACDLSREDDAQALLDKAAAALEKEPYAVTIKMNFESDNEDLNQLFSLMNNIDVPCIVDGENIAIDMSMDMMGYTAGVKIIVADMVLYYDMELLGQNVKMKATMSEDQYQEFMEGSNTEMTVMPEDFAELTVETKDGKKYITCVGLSEESKEKLDSMMASYLDGLDGEITLSDVSYIVILNDGKYESLDMACVYSFVIAEETVNVTFNMSAEYSYDNVEKITAPADADAYEELNYDEIMA